MARLIEVEDPADDRLLDYIRLRDVQLRRSLESTQGLFIAEGEKVVRRAVSAGFHVRSFLMTQRWLAGLQSELAAAPEVPCYVVSDEVAEQVTGFHVHRGALASLERRPLLPLDDVVTAATRLLVLEDIVDHTNVGAAFRSGAALGADAVLLSPRCADPLYRRSIKVSMGAVFSLPWTRLVDWYDAVPALSRAGFSTVALTLSGDAVDLAAVPTRDKVALLVGSEGHGLSARWEHSADVRAKIPMAAGIDSLNAAAATAVACYALWAGRRDIS
ncbi:MAG: RNA methyltransferase [Nocardioidaceae bacterium]|nr:RNA methyltransferase [Nocardioidaceae bacterium]